MFTTYFDASGHRDDLKTPLVAVAGFVSSVDAWDEFQVEWKSLLHTHEITVPFHASDFFRSIDKGKLVKGYEAFKDKPDKRDAFLDDAIAAIKKRSMESFVSAVLVSTLRDAEKIYKIPQHLSYPYPLCGLNVLARVGQWIRQKGIEDMIRFVFEAGDDHKGELLKACDSLPLQGRKLRPIFEERNDIGGLQAADLLAWYCGYWGRRVALGKPEPPFWLKRLGEELRGDDYWGIITKAELLTFCDSHGFEKR